MNRFSLIEITKKNVKKVSDDVWQKYFDMRIQFDERPGSKSPFLDKEQLKKLMTDRFENDKYFISINIILKNEGFHGFIVFASVLNSARKKYLEVCYNSVHLDSDKEIIDIISKQTKKYYRKNRDGLILFVTQNNKFANIAKKLKGKVGEYDIRMTLPPKEANKKLMRKWLKEVPIQNPDIRLEFYTLLPDNLIDEYSAIFTQLMEDMPGPHYFNTFIDPKRTKEREHKAKGTNQISYRYLAFNEKNKLIGMTNIYINADQPEYPYQYMTGTLKEYRQRGIGKWMKAANFFKITKDFPRKIREIITETSPDNFGSKRTSKLLGFKYQGCEVFYELDVDKL